VAVGNALLLDHRHPGIQIDVDPAQPDGLTKAQTAQGNQPPHHGQPIPAHLSRSSPSRIAAGDTVRWAVFRGWSSQPRFGCG
jgi:hypothetical protein